MDAAPTGDRPTNLAQNRCSAGDRHCLGYAGNYFKLPLFFGVDFLFGSIAVLVVAHLYGMTWGAIVALITSLYTIQIWGHPYAVIIFTVEACFVGWTMRRKHRNLILIDAIYWVCVGMPLVWLFYFQALKLPFHPVLLVMLKQSVNGIFNALVASFILTCLPLSREIGRSKDNATLSLQQILSNVMVAIVFLPVLTLMVVDGRLAKHTTEAKIQTTLQTVSDHLIGELRVWQQYRPKEIESFIQYLRPESYPDTIITLFDREGRARAIANLTPSLQTLPDKQQGEVRPLSVGVYQWLPMGDIPPLARWRQSTTPRRVCGCAETRYPGPPHDGPTDSTHYNHICD
ncbi:MAG: ECF transporter S component [Chloroflexaceae bacterium]|nr:ECF transporter S component [Chloroflexaceae bacterium]